MVKSYEEGKEILVLYDHFYYRAKILQISTKKGQKLYYVKYRSFSTAYNEDVTIDRIKEATPENIAFEENRKKEFERERKARKGKKTTTKTSTKAPAKPPAAPPTTTKASKSTSTKTTKSATSKSAATTAAATSTSATTLKTGRSKNTSLKPTKKSDEKVVNICPDPPSIFNQAQVPFQPRLPPQLRKILWEDYEAIELRKIVHIFPRAQTVALIIADYLMALKMLLFKKQETETSNMNNLNTNTSTAQQQQQQQQQQQHTQPPLDHNIEALFDQAVETMLGIRCIFDKCLLTTLLHKSERVQYAELLNNPIIENNPSTVYGIEHLLRLFVKLPVLLFSETMTEYEIGAITYHINDFLAWLSHNYKNYLLPKPH